MITEQQTLFIDSLEEALRGCVNALRGPKAVGVMLWPELPAEVAAKRLNHCLDPDRPEKLELSQVILIAKRARAVGCHTLIAFMCSELSYRWEEVNPETEVQRLQREFIEAQRQLVKLAERIDTKSADIAAASTVRRVA